MRIPARDKAAADASKDSSAPSRQRRPGEDRAPAAPAAALSALPALQRSVGNAAVTRMLAAGHGAGPGRGDAPVQRATAHQVLRSPGRPLDAPLREEMENRLGADFSDVRVHSDPLAQRSAAEIGARAYTSGSHVVVTDGGKDKHTLAHELTHVIQQRQGPVAGTDTGHGLRVSDPGDRFEREAEANASRVMAAPAPVQRAAREEHGTHAPVSGERAVVQRKGPEELGPSLPVDPPRPGGLLGRLMSRNPAPADPLVAQVRAGIAAYDSDPVRDPMHCMIELSRLTQEIAPAEDDAPPAVKPWLAAALDIVKAELVLVNDQLVRDAEFPVEAGAPFSAMTTNGMLWQQAQWADSAAAFHMHGPSYFRELSELNRAGMAKEIGRGQGDRNWVPDVRTKLTSALQRSVLCHYTGRSRAETMLAQGRMKSKTELLRADPDAPNNSEAYDKHVLANEGFVFFFLEVPGSPFRSTRFSGDDEPARIQIPLTESPLMSQGWLMLSDFAQREYPTVRARPEDPAQTESKLNTREDAFSAEFTLPVRKFDVGAGAAADSLDMEAVMEVMGNESNQERRGQIMFSTTQALSDEHSTMTYGSGAQEQVHSERLRSNTLMGRDIVPGLVERAVVEIQRLEAVNPQLADRLKAMSGADLMRFLLKDLVRPQAMLPNTVDLGAATVVLESGQRVGVPTH
ncbi:MULTISPECIES: eCIS core domain-containing protein [unclassified Streptomyces]|uniref:eCIS core domain-containing protein n=1 Tax=unclassified Streptomyces TaxID=2593676 RepID=UPI00386CC624